MLQHCCEQLRQVSPCVVRCPCTRTCTTHPTRFLPSCTSDGVGYLREEKAYCYALRLPSRIAVWILWCWKSSTCHGTCPLVVVECVVSRWDTSVEALEATSILLSICSSLLLSARNSRRQLEVDLCTAHTINGNKSQNTTRTSMISTVKIPKIPRSDIVLIRSSVSLCCNGTLLPESP